MLRIDTSQFDKYAKYLRTQANKLEKYKMKYYAYLLNNVHLQGELKAMIEMVVYMDSKEPSWYKRKERLLEPEAIKYKIEEGKLTLYIDDEWLQSQTADVGNLTKKTGFDKAVHDGSANKSYSERIEEGYTYYNNGNNHPATNKPRPFFEEFVKETKKNIKSGEASPYRIIEPILKGWR